MDRSRGSSAREVATLGVLFAMALTLSYLEGLVPLTLPVPGVRLGLSNIVVMYCMYLVGAGRAFLLSALKALFVFLVRGMNACFLSLGGGLLSVCAMLLLLRLLRGREAVTAVSITGAVAHNAGQLLVFSLLMGRGTVFWYYAPVLAAAGVLVGTLTAVLLRALLPSLRRLRMVRGEEERL